MVLYLKSLVFVSVMAIYIWSYVFTYMPIFIKWVFNRKIWISFIENNIHTAPGEAFCMFFLGMIVFMLSNGVFMVFLYMLGVLPSKTIINKLDPFYNPIGKHLRSWMFIYIFVFYLIMLIFYSITFFVFKPVYKTIFNIMLIFLGVGLIIMGFWYFFLIKFEKENKKDLKIEVKTPPFKTGLPMPAYFQEYHWYDQVFDGWHGEYSDEIFPEFLTITEEEDDKLMYEEIDRDLLYNLNLSKCVIKGCKPKNWLDFDFELITDLDCEEEKEVKKADLSIKPYKTIFEIEEKTLGLIKQINQDENIKSEMVYLNILNYIKPAYKKIGNSIVYINQDKKLLEGCVDFEVSNKSIEDMFGRLGLDIITQYKEFYVNKLSQKPKDIYDFEYLHRKNMLGVLISFIFLYNSIYEEDKHWKTLFFEKRNISEAFKKDVKEGRRDIRDAKRLNRKIVNIEQTIMFLNTNKHWFYLNNQLVFIDNKYKHIYIKDYKKFLNSLREARGFLKKYITIIKLTNIKNEKNLKLIEK